jgi:hypothetical protein
VRLTPFGDHPAGSKVTPDDNDIGMPITSLGSTIVYLNLFGSSAYDLLDPVYVHQFGTLTVTNDVRLNITPRTGLNPGTKVHDFEPDLNKIVTALPVPLPSIGPTLAFFDVNGNGAYDYWDDVYMNVPTAVPVDSVTTNNIRLSGPV